MMEDIAILTGGQAIFEALGVKLESIDLTHLGRAKKVIVDKDNTTIIEGAGKSDAIKARIDQIRREIENSTSRITTRKSSKSVWRNSPAALPRSTSVRRPSRK